MTDHQIISIDSSDGYQLACRYWPASNARALLLLTHGVISHSGWLQSITNGLANSGISCLASDRRGAGLNDENRGDAPDADSLIQDLDAVLEWCLQWKLPLHLCGFCWGANYVVNYLYQKHPPIESLSLLAPSLFPSELILNQSFNTGDSGEPTEIPVMPIECFTEGAAFEQVIKPDPLRLRFVSPRFNRITAEFSKALLLKFLRLRMPTLVILGQDDAVVDNASTEEIFAKLSCSRKVIAKLPGQHGIQFDAPEQVNQTLSSWIFHSNGDSH